MGVVRRAFDVLAVAGIAAAVIASQSSDAEPTTFSVSRASAPGTSPAAAPALGPVTVHAIDHELAAAPSPATTGAVVELVQLSVVGGSLSLVNDHASVTLVRDGSQWTAVLPPVRVVDARGTHAGWRVTWRIADVSAAGCERSRVAPGLVHLAPSPPVVVSGTPDGLVAGPSGSAHNAGRTLARAEPGSGGGTYEAGGTLSVRLPRCPEADSVLVDLSYTVR
jgi:hypothetical protein